MGITEKELRDIIGSEPEIEKVSTVSSDGRNLLTRIPKAIAKNIGLKKCDKLVWIIEKKEIKLEVKKNAKEKI